MPQPTKGAVGPSANKCPVCQWPSLSCLGATLFPLHVRHNSAYSSLGLSAVGFNQHAQLNKVGDAEEGSPLPDYKDGIDGSEIGKSLRNRPREARHYAQNRDGPRADLAVYQTLRIPAQTRGETGALPGTAA